MKRIITATISVILTVTLSAQDRTPMDKIWEEIEKITTARQDAKMKVNHGGGQLLYVHNGIVGKEFLCSTDCEGVTTSFNNFTPEEIEAVNERNRKEVFDKIFGAIRHNLDSLMAISEESYHFESHSHDADTITYSLCLKNGGDSIARIKANDGTMFYPEALETVFLNYTASPKPCGKHIRGFGTLGYNKRLPLPGGKSYYFDKQPYLDKIIPVLKRKDIKSWSFKWAQSDDYDIDAHHDKEIYSATRVHLPKNAGQMIGTMYFIPREKVRLAEEIFTAIDSITLNYTDIHPEQMFMYIYNVKKEVMQYTESSNISTVFEGTTGKGHVSTCVLFGITPKGYYVAIADSENNACIPKEWSTLKSFFNGEKKYIKQK